MVELNVKRLYVLMLLNLVKFCDVNFFFCLLLGVILLYIRFFFVWCKKGLLVGSRVWDFFLWMIFEILGFWFKGLVRGRLIFRFFFRFRRSFFLILIVNDLDNCFDGILLWFFNIIFFGFRLRFRCIDLELYCNWI